MRKKLIEDFDLQAVVSLPAGLFKPYAGVKTAVLVFKKPAKGLKHNNEVVWFYEVSNDGYDPDKIVGGGRPETPEKNDMPDLLKQWKAYKDSEFKTPPGVEAGRLLEADSEAPRYWWARIEAIAENGYNLAAGRYKPQVGQKPPEEDPADLIKDVLAIKREIAKNLVNLLKEVEK